MHDARFMSLVICASEAKHVSVRVQNNIVHNNVMLLCDKKKQYSNVVGGLLEISSISPVEAGNVSTGLCEILPASRWCLRKSCQISGRESFSNFCLTVYFYTNSQHPTFTCISPPSQSIWSTLIFHLALRRAFTFKVTVRSGEELGATASGLSG